jgi:outer membrane receptor protein involved in Fe transport
VIPDECLKLQPASCLGGAGGVTLPLAGSYDVSEIFAEAIVPLAQDQAFARSLDLELGYRHSDYNLTGVNETYKYGVSWEPMESLRFRAMRQRAARAPNVSELFAPISSGLANATSDPCSVAGAPQSAELTARCIATGMTAAQVGVIADGVVSGQIQGFFGTDPNALPEPETADTTTVGLVWSPEIGVDVLSDFVVTLDWYNIEIENFIAAFGAQEVLDGCYQNGVTALCDRVARVAGQLDLPGAGIELFTTNLLSLQAEGIELGARAGFDLGNFGSLTAALNLNQYLTQESHSATFTDPIDCLGYFGNQCGNPLPEFRWTQRTTWEIGDFTLSYLWRHFGEVEIEEAQQGAATFDEFESIDSFDYFDLAAAWNVTNWLRVDASIRNVTNEDPPVVGNEAGTTSTNSGNTFPAVYDTLGRTFAVGMNVRF